MSVALESIARHGAAQSIFSISDEEVFAGEWDPRAIFKAITVEPDFWRGKSVLEIAANTGGLSVEIARAGATVTLTEPDPYQNTLSLARHALDRVIADEGLNIRIQERDFFGCRDLPKHDVIVCLGLLYHFRYPQLMLDMLSEMEPTYLIVSTQTHPGDDLALVNRRQSGLLRTGHLADDIVLTGWHPTRPLFERMLQWAGFGEIESLTNENFPHKRKGLTNSAYYRGRLLRPADPDAEMRVFYPR